MTDNEIKIVPPPLPAPQKITSYYGTEADTLEMEQMLRKEKEQEQQQSDD